MGVRFFQPTPIWEDHPCYIVGGGPSLDAFPWDALRGRLVLGCNATCYMSPVLIPWTIFGDASFIDQHRDALELYVARGGQVVSPSSKFRKARNTPPWLKVMNKQTKGLGTDRLGWNGNTGASAINLALLMGANPIYLLGYDMKQSKGKSNFHNAYKRQADEKAYARFLKGMEFVVRDMKLMFPDRRVINLEDDTSALHVFPKESLRDHFQLAGVGGE